MPFLLRVLGPVTVTRDGDPALVSLITQPRQLALLVYLVLARPRGLQPRAQVMSLLWPEQDEAHARRGLRNALHGVRSILGHEAVLSVGSTLVGIDSALVACDALLLERGDGSHRPPAAVEPLQGLHVSGAPEFDHWIADQQQHLRHLVAHHAPSPHERPGRRDDPREERPARATVRHGLSAEALYLRGHYCFLRAAHDGELATLEQCRTYFERALELDPSFAPAIAGLSNYYAVAARRGVHGPFEDTFATVLELAARALALDDTLAVPHVHFGVEAMYLTDDWARAGREFTLAVQKDPSYAEGHRFLSIWLSLDGRPAEALAAAEEAVRMEPDIVTMLGTLGAARTAADDLPGAEEVLRRVLAIDPRHAPSRERLLRLLERQERFAEALDERDRGGLPFDPGGFRAAWVHDGAEGYRACRRAELARRVEALEARIVERGLTTVSDRFAPPIVQLVAMLAEMGEWNRIHAWVLQAKAARPALARWFAAMPELRDAPVRVRAAV